VEVLDGTPRSVYQDFKWDIYYALKGGVDLLHNYERLVLVYPKYSHHPTGITEGVLQFCLEQQKDFSVIQVSDDVLQRDTAYIVLTESHLALLIKKVRSSNLHLGKDIGIISFNETVFKELLDITVITTDFKDIGRSAAKLILSGEVKQNKNPFKLIRRSSL
jgi:hypothetical protein